jgi:hypothetical protein
MAGDLLGTMRRGDFDRVVHATIMLMSVLVIYDG